MSLLHSTSSVLNINSELIVVHIWLEQVVASMMVIERQRTWNFFTEHMLQMLWPVVAWKITR